MYYSLIINCGSWGTALFIPAMSYFQAEIPTCVFDFLKKGVFLAAIHNSFRTEGKILFLALLLLSFHCMSVTGSGFGI